MAQALSQVSQNLQGDEVLRLKRVLGEQMLALERSNMECEDYRSRIISPYRGDRRYLTWKEYAVKTHNELFDREDELSERDDQIYDALSVLRDSARCLLHRVMRAAIILDDE